MTYWEIETYQLQIDLMPIEHKSTDTPLHHDSMSYWENQHITKGRLTPLLIEYKSTEPYYTSTVWAIEISTHTQGRQTTLLIEHKSKEPYYTRIIWPIEKLRHTPMLIKHKSTELYYTSDSMS